MDDDFLISVRQFISQNIESLAQLEALLLLLRETDRWWTAEDLAKALYISSEMSAVLLLDLARRGFATAGNPGYRYQAKDEATHHTIQELARIYQERRVAVITEIYSKPLNKVQTFADAFRLRKEE